MSDRFEKSMQYGRSMVEMLGVLSIMGILTIGGIAGYSKAMMQYKINKAADQITQIVSGLRMLYSTQDDYGTTISNAILKKGHIVPDEMWESDNLINPFAGSVSIEPSGKKAINDNKAFVISYSGLPKEACMALATYDWGSGSSSGLIALSVGTSITNQVKGCQGAEDSAIACPGGSSLSVPMPVIKAANKCTEGSTINIKFF